MAVKRETSEIAQLEYWDQSKNLMKPMMQIEIVVVYNPEVVDKHEIVTGCQASKFEIVAVMDSAAMDSTAVST